MKKKHMMFRPLNPPDTCIRNARESVRWNGLGDNEVYAGVV